VLINENKLFIMMKQISKGVLLPIVYCTSIFAGLLGVNHIQLYQQSAS